MYFAELNNNNIVIRVVRADEAFIKNTPGRWQRTCYLGTISNKFAGIGDTYVSYINMFIPPRPNNQYELDTKTGRWKPQKSAKIAPEGESIPGSYSILLKDNNGKQIYEKVFSSDDKKTVEKIPVRITGNVLDTRV